MPARTETLDGRTALILAAEQLFAEYGLHGASFRQISDAAKQKNGSAIQYHFGTRDRLVEAVFENRMQNINPRRLAMLEEIATAKDTQIRSLVSVLVWPLAEELRPRAEGNHYLQFLSRATREKQMVLKLAPWPLMSGWFQAIEALSGLISGLPELIIRQRLLIAADQCVSSLAMFEAEQVGQSPEFSLQVETLIDMITAALLAPVSFQGETEFKKLRAKPRA
ncbi:TetR family transcriptional regulator [Hyphomonas sp. WL0036]|uniref:TetR/AcrR family transcriptional regulator n=1 Tax=Hyphomonas sediminis TaxID=2866160 RepID=UPI001C7E794F|nr:TetR family transcriptional regulator [Hyphomonas sediminis]MBY9065842.1 TetR family transcriptional regulator [Hyphomonas sediminis]